MPCCERSLPASQAAEERRRSADRDSRLARAEAAAAAAAAEREHAAGLHAQLEAELAVAHQERCARLYRVKVGLGLGFINLLWHWAPVRVRAWPPRGPRRAALPRPPTAAGIAGARDRACLEPAGRADRRRPRQARARRGRDGVHAAGRAARRAQPQPGAAARQRRPAAPRRALAARRAGA